MKLKIILCLFILGSGLFGCATKQASVCGVTAQPKIAPEVTLDSIDLLVTDLSNSHGLWINGFPSPRINLPKSATIQELAAEVFGKADPDLGKVTNYGILKSRRVQIDSGFYLAILADTNLGKKIVLTRYDQESGDWWRRVYNVDPPNNRWY